MRCNRDRSRAVAHRIGTTAAIPVVVQNLGLNHVSHGKSGNSLNPMSLSSERSNSFGGLHLSWIGRPESQCRTSTYLTGADMYIDSQAGIVT